MAELADLANIEDLLFYCWEWLERVEIMNIRLVCKNWKKMASHEVIYKTLCRDFGLKIDEHERECMYVSSWRDLFLKIVTSEAKLEIFSNGMDLGSYFNDLEKILKHFRIDARVDVLTNEMTRRGSCSINRLKLMKALRIERELGNARLTGMVVSTFDLVPRKLYKEYQLFLKNDDDHSFNQVMNQLNKALKLEFWEIASIAWQAHSLGETVCFSSSKKELCKKVEDTLKLIDLKCEIREATVPSSLNLLKTLLEQSTEMGSLNLTKFLDSTVVYVSYYPEAGWIAQFQTFIDDFSSVVPNFTIHRSMLMDVIRKGELCVFTGIYRIAKDIQTKLRDLGYLTSIRELYVDSDSEEDDQDFDEDIIEDDDLDGLDDDFNEDDL